MERVRVDSGELNTVESGSGGTLVLVHGSWSDLHTWDPVVELLASSHRVVRYDRRGHGSSTQPAASRREHEDDLATLIEAVSDSPVAVLGTSFGGSIATGLASRRPDLVAALSIHEPPLLSLAPQVPGTEAELMAVGAGVASVLEAIDAGDHRGAAESFAEMVLGPGAWAELPPPLAETMVRSAPSFLAEQSDPGWAAMDPDALGAIACPVLVTAGTESPGWFRVITSELARGIPGARLSELAGAGHAPHGTHPEAYAALVGDFLHSSRVTRV